MPVDNPLELITPYVKLNIKNFGEDREETLSSPSFLQSVSRCTDKRFCVF